MGLRHIFGSKCACGSPDFVWPKPPVVSKSVSGSKFCLGFRNSLQAPNPLKHPNPSRGPHLLQDPQPPVVLKCILESRLCLCFPVGSKSLPGAKSVCRPQTPVRLKVMSHCGLRSKLCLQLSRPLWTLNPLKHPNSFWGPRLLGGPQPPAVLKSTLASKLCKWLPSPLWDTTSPLGPTSILGSKLCLWVP